MPYVSYMCEQMLHPDRRDCHIFLSEYIIFVAITLLHAAYNEFRLNRLSPALDEAIQNLPDGVSHVFGGSLNVEAFKSMIFIYNPVFLEFCPSEHVISFQQISLCYTNRR